MIASNPVAAWRCRAGTLSVSAPMILTAMNQVTRLAPNAIAAPSATGLRCARFAPTMLAVMATRTRMHSSPSRKTRTLMSRNAAVGLLCGRSGSGVPWAVIPCQRSSAMTEIAATVRKSIVPKRKAELPDRTLVRGAELVRGEAEADIGFIVAVPCFTRKA